MRELIEFECNDCRGFFFVNLNLWLEGDFRFVCPQCGREHPRTVKDGQLKGDPIERLYADGVGKRAFRNNREGYGERIIVPKSAYSKKSRLKAMEQANGGFLAQCWRNLAGQTQQQV
jgi:hypothetical protein